MSSVWTRLALYGVRRSSRRSWVWQPARAKAKAPVVPSVQVARRQERV